MKPKNLSATRFVPVFLDISIFIAALPLQQVHVMTKKQKGSSEKRVRKLERERPVAGRRWHLTGKHRHSPRIQSSFSLSLSPPPHSYILIFIYFFVLHITLFTYAFTLPSLPSSLLPLPPPLSVFFLLVCNWG